MTSLRIVSTPAGHFRLSYTSGIGGRSQDVVDVARRWDAMPDDLSAVTDIVADPCWSDGSRFGGPDDGRPEVTVNGVSYTGTLYYVSRGYYIGADHSGDNGWCVTYPADDNGQRVPFGHYWTGQHLTRYTDARGFQPVSDAALRKLSGYLSESVAEMLADVDGLRAYWCERFESTAEYAVLNARRELEAANAALGWARRYGSSRPDIVLPVWGEDQ